MTIRPYLLPGFLGQSTSAIPSALRLVAEGKARVVGSKVELTNISTPEPILINP